MTAEGGQTPNVMPSTTMAGRGSLNPGGTDGSAHVVESLYINIIDFKVIG